MSLHVCFSLYQAWLFLQNTFLFCFVFLYFYLLVRSVLCMHLLFFISFSSLHFSLISLLPKIKAKKKRKGTSLRIPILASVPFLPNQLHFPLWFAWHRLDPPPESRVMRSCSDVLTSALNAFTCMALPLPWQPPKHPELALYPRFGRRNLAWSHEKRKENVLTIFEIVGVFRPSLFLLGNS